MTAPLAAFCRKCGGVEIGVKYRPERGWSPGKHEPVRIHPEELQRTCSTCGYHWTEPCLDDPKRKESA